MKQMNSRKNRSHVIGLVSLSAMAAFGISSCTPDYDLDTRFPEWLGSSIYETLQEGITDENGKTYHFDNYVRLIDDLDYKNVLAKTGSKTLFVADDSAFVKFLNSGKFSNLGNGGEVTYDDLSLAQKKMILNGSMLNNVYQVAMLSSSKGPILGDCMRRISSSSIYDSVPVLNQTDMPDNALWHYYKYTTDKTSIPLFQDANYRPMVFFVNKFLTTKKITDSDYDFLFNQPEGTHKAADATVNGVKIIIPNKKCFNGFLHVMEDVIYSLPNMAESLRQTEDATVFSSILTRYCAPYPVLQDPEGNDLTGTLKQNVEQGKTAMNIPGFDWEKDTIFQLRYFAERGQGNRKNNQTPGGHTVHPDEVLKFDPGWNVYYSSSSASDENVALQQNMAVMLVPLDSVIKGWWLDGGGKALRERYGVLTLAGTTPSSISDVIEDLSGVPDKVISKLVYVNMLNSLVGSVPSKFDNVLDDANDKMGITREDVARVQMCCNGALYYTTKVFSPTAYRSVSYPVLVTDGLDIINMAIKDYDFDAYLNSMVATYSFFVPIVRDADDPKLPGKMVYVDPVSFNPKEKVNTDSLLKALVFEWDASNKVVVNEYLYNDTTNEVIVAGSGSQVTSSDVIRNRLEDLLDYHIIIGDVEEKDENDATTYPYHYFKTKGRGTVYFDMGGASFHADMTESEIETELAKMTVAGGYQLESKRMRGDIGEDVVKILNRHDLSKKSATKGNGRTYIIDHPLQTSRSSVYDVLTAPEYADSFKLFFDMMQVAVTTNPTTGKEEPLLSNEMNGNAIGSAYNISTLNTYHYTLYVPTNASIQDLYDRGILLSPADISLIEEEDSMEIWEEMYPTLTSEEIDSIYYRPYIQRMYNKYLLALTAKDDTLDITAFTPAKYAKVLYGKITNFVKYHIQDNSVYTDSEFKVDLRENPLGQANYETAFMNVNSQFEKLTVKGGENITVWDKNNRHERHVIKKNTASGLPLYNIMCREYELNGNLIETSSYVVVHQIDGPLCNGDILF